MIRKLEDFAYRKLVKLGRWMKRRRDARDQARRESTEPSDRDFQRLMDAARKGFDEEFDRIEAERRRMSS